MSRLLRHPLLSLAVLAMWLLLNTSLAPKSLLMGALLAFTVPLLMDAMQVERLRLRAPATMLRLAGTVMLDVLRSNVEVAAILLAGRRRRRVSGFVYLQLELRSPAGLALLAIIVSSVPGTLWVQYDAGTGRLLMHVLDLTDDANWEQLIKQRYERPLMAIFE